MTDLESDKGNTVGKNGRRQKGEDSHFVKSASMVTLAIKIGGLALAGHEALFVDPPRDAVVFAIAAFMMAGATGLDNIIDRFLGGK